MTTSSLTEALDIDVSIVQAPIGSATCPALAVSVSNAGGLVALDAIGKRPALFSEKPNSAPTHR